MSSKNIINFVFFQLLWLCCVIGASSDTLWPAVVCFVLYLAWQLQKKNRAKGDIFLIISACLLGFIVDSAWLKLGILSYQSPFPFESYAPLWIVFLWSGFALTLNHSLAWLKPRLGFAVLFSLLSAPASYLAGAKLGALIFLQDTMLALLILAASWGVLFPLLVCLARYMQTDLEFYSASAKVLE